MYDIFGSGDLRENAFLNVIGLGLNTIYEGGKLGYGYVTDPKVREDAARNTSQFTQNFGRYSSNGRESLLTEPIFGTSKIRQNQDIQFKQLADANAVRDPTNGRWNVRNQTGFDDERDNQIDDRALRQQSYANYQEKKGGSDMSDDDNDYSRNRGKTVINSSRPSDYAPGERANNDRAKIQLDYLQGLYGIDSTANVNRQNNQWQSQDRKYGINLGEQTKRYGIDVGAKETRAKTLAELQADLDRNRVTREVGFNANATQLEGSKFRTTTEASTERYKWTTVNETDKYKRNTLDRTEIAKEQIKAGTYGRSQEDINSMAIEANARKVNQEYNDRMMNYGRYQMEINKFNNDVRNAERAYSDQRSDLSNARSAAESRFNIERNDRIAQTEYDRQQKKLDRDRAYAEFDIRRNDTNATLAQQNAFRQQELAYRQQEINSAVALDQARIAQIYADTKLKNDQFGAGRADISYNRNVQRSRSIAF